MARPESIQWQHRRWLGDNTVLQMDWDATAMHFHLLMMSIQEKPPGSIPNDMAAIRRWLRSPSEDTWRRVRPQIFAAWQLREDRWFNTGMVETFERKERFSKRYENSTKKVRESAEKQENSNSIKELDFDVGSKPKPKSSFNEQEVSLMVMNECHLSGKHLQQSIEQQLLSFKGKDLKPVAEEMIAAINEYKTAGGSKIFLWLSEGEWLRKDVPHVSKREQEFQDAIRRAEENAESDAGVPKFQT